MPEIMPVTDKPLFCKLPHQVRHFILTGNLFIMAAAFDAQFHSELRGMGQ